MPATRSSRPTTRGLARPGPHAYLIGEAEGRSVLDMVRAARQLNPDIGKKFLISGHSQGGHAALFAAGLAKSWVPDLNLTRHRGLRAGLAPEGAGRRCCRR